MALFDDLIPQGGSGKGDRLGATPVPDDLFADLIPADDGSMIDAVPGARPVVEAMKGIPEGAISMGGTTLKGVAGMQKGAQRSSAEFGRQQLAVMDRIDRGETVPEMDDALGYGQMSDGQRKAARAEMEAAQEAFAPGTVEDSALYRAGEAVQETARGVLPAEPGYEDSTSRNIGRGLGSVATGAAASIVGGPVAAGALFTMAGSGEAVERAIANGATEEEIIAAAKAGQIPGLTDSVPVETLLGRIPLPGGQFVKVPVGMIGGALRAAKRIGFQALVEGIQEGGQEFLQNAIQAAYDEDKSLSDGVAEGAGLGATVGGIVETAITPFRRRGGGQQTAVEGRSATEAGTFDDLVPETKPADPVTTVKQDRLPIAPDAVPGDVERLSSPRLTPEDRASPIPNDIIDDGKALLAGEAAQPSLIEQPAVDPVAIEPVAPVETASVAPLDRAILRRAGSSDAEIDIMSPDERAVDIAEAREAGVAPSSQDLAASEQYRPATPIAAPASPAIAAELPALPPVVAQDGREAVPAPMERPAETNAAPEPPVAEVSDEPAMPNAISVGPTSVRTNRLRVGRPLYRETSIDGLTDLLGINRDGGYGGRLFASSDRDLALGQGNNKGVMVTFRDGWVSGREHFKPGTAVTEGKEYELDYLAAKAIERVEISPKAAKSARPLVKILAQQAGLQRTKLDDGTVVYSRETAPGAREAETAPASQAVALPSTPGAAVRPVAPVTDATPAAPRQPIERRDIGPDTAVTAAGREVPVRYAVVEVSSLVASQRDEGGVNPDFPADLQPRDRSRGVSQTQIQSISTGLNPRLLDRSPRASDGAPIISADGVVESGNGRVLAIRKAYTDGNAEGYRSYLAEQGYPVDGLNQPVLVRVREGEMETVDRQAFTREANERDTLAMSATEQAMADATAMKPNLIALYRGGEIDEAGNRDFARAFIRDVVNVNDQARMTGPDGAMSQDAVRRVRSALLARAYGDADLVSALVESPDTNIKAIGGAATDVAAEWAQMRLDVEAGTISPESDQTSKLLDAVRVVERARREGRKVAEYVGQRDIFSGQAMDPKAEAFLRLMFRNHVSWTMPVGRDKLADALRFFVAEMRKTNAGTDLLGEPAATPEQVLALAREKQDRSYGPAGSQEQLRLERRPPVLDRDGQDVRPDGGRGAEQGQRGRPAQDGAEGTRSGDQPAGEGDTPRTGAFHLNDEAHRNAQGSVAADNVGDSDRSRNSGAFLRREVSGGVDIDYILTEGFVDKAKEVGARLRAELDRMGLKDVALRVSERIVAQIDGETAPVNGVYFRGLIDVALDGRDIDNTLGHEAVHAIDRMGLFSKTERSILIRKSSEDWIARYDIEDRYAGMPAEVLVEEGIAHAYADWLDGKKFDGLIARSFKRIKAFLEALGNVLRGAGFDSADAIFGRIESGEVGNRQRRDRELSDAAMFSLTERRDVVDEQGMVRPQAVTAALNQRIMRSIKGRKDDRESLGDYSHRKLIDYLHPVRMMIESAGGTVQDTMDAYLQARLAEDAALARIQGIHDRFVTPMVEALAKGGASLDDLHRYLYARHVPERNRVVGLRNEEGSDMHRAATDHSVKGASGWSTNEAKAALRELQKDAEKFTAIKEAGRLMREMLDASLLEQKQAGLISAQAHDRLREQWQHYVPLRADEDVDEKGNFTPGRGSGFDVRGDEFKGATGRTTEAENIVAWAVALSERTALRAEKNAVGKAMLRFINANDPKGESLAKVYWADEEGFGDIEKAPEVHRREIDKDGKVVSRKVPPSTISPDMFAVKVGGKAFYIQFADEKVGLALKRLGQVELDAVSRLARKWTSFQSLINTRANPAFVPINIIRDAATGGVHLLDEGFTATETARIVANIPKAWGALWRKARGRAGEGDWDAALKEYVAAGGKITFEPHKTLDDAIEGLRKQMTEAVEGRPAPKAAWQAFVKFVGDLNDAGENGIRLAAFVAAREKGRTVKRAAFLARDLTVDFKKHGEVGPLLNSWYVFFNASVQGNYNIANRLYRSRTVRRAAFAIAASGVLIDILNRVLSGRDDDDEESHYSKMLRSEPWKFERQMVIFYGGEAGEYVSIPLPYGYNAIHHLGVQASAAAFGDVTPLEAIASIARVGFDAFNPVGNGGSWLNLFAPTLADPFVEIATNQNFAGAPIAPTAFPGDTRPESQRFWQSTPDVFRWVAEKANEATGGNEIEPGLIDVAPDVYEHLWGYVSGGIGRFFGQVYDAGAKVATGRADEIEPENVPWVRSFFGRVDEDSKRSQYYRQREAVQTAKDRLDAYRDAGDPEALREFIERNRTAVNSINAFDAAERNLRKIRKTKRAIDNDKELSRAEKDERLKPLDEAEQRIMGQARTVFARNRKAEEGR